MVARVLVVDDDPASLELASYLLRAFGYDVLVAGDGAQGLVTARASQPDLVVCDIRMAGLDGFELLRAALADPILRAIPFIAVTASVLPGERDAVMNAGFDCLIEKPIDPKSFVHRVEAFLPAHLRAQERPLPVSSGPGTGRPPAMRATLLVVDDTPSNLELKRCCLEPLGYAVMTSGNAARALLVARRHRPDLILSDVHMAEGSGFDFLRAVKADPTLRDIPFVLISSTHWEETVQKHGMALGAARYLLRPLHPSKLLDAIAECLAEVRPIPT